jgi:hypothetical protein
VLHLFRNKSPYTVLILLILTLLLKSQMLVQPQAPQEIEGYFLYNGIIRVFNILLRGNAFFYTFLAVLMAFLQALYLNFITARHKLFVRVSYFPALVYILFTSVHPAFNYFSVPLLINWCMLIGIDIFLGFSHSVSPRKNIFNSALAISLAGLLHFSAVGYVLVFIAALLLLRPFSAGEAVVGAMGYLTPVYFAACILFIVDMLPALAAWPDIDFSIVREIYSPVYLGILTTGLLILSGGSVYAMQQQLPKATISIRRSWLAILAYLLVSIAVAMFGSIKVNNAWLLTIPALSMVIAQGLMIEKSKWFSNFIFYFSIAIVIACRLALNK